MEKRLSDLRLSCCFAAPSFFGTCGLETILVFCMEKPLLQTYICKFNFVELRFLGACVYIKIFFKKLLTTQNVGDIIMKLSDKTVNLIVRGSAGIGRQARLRGVCQRRMGSSPITRTSIGVLTGFQFPVRTLFLFIGFLFLSIC